MNTKPLFAAVLLGLLTLTGCNGNQSSDASSAPSQPNWLSTPALPIIQDAVFSLTPTFNGQRNPLLMEQVCGLASGELKQEQVNAFLSQRNVDVTKVPKQGDALSLLVNGDKASQATACAAHLATTVLTTVDAGEFLQSVVPASGTNGQSNNTSASKPAEPTLQIDNARLGQLLPIKLAEARVNAEVFALIAAELQRRPGLTVSEYHKQAVELFARLAPVYLERIKAQLPPAGTNYALVQLDGQRFAFTSSTGNLFEYTSEGLVLRQNGITWYGQGKLLGQEYPLKVAYFPSSVNKLLAPKKK
ncbi:hypothetical protein [Pseudomonas schmalbachii]|uniref:Lipoprotein n=1 Tax=Pseudomonas schmalbachii TaxID=2816993 RepID=A0ABS3TIW8_9PSED|nr:hypothetical protein [Pseudomonas schmalbachii]MBO3273606.1 hypothetical protein [Pseudomonas schmalbachii]